jgi:hypothetical protein
VAKQKHADWFDRGAMALRALTQEQGRGDLLPAEGDWSLCPLCLDGLSAEELDTGEMTAEHVPPRSFGGRELVLTCKQCNNTHGGSFDGQAHREDRIRQLMSGQGGRTETATFAVDGFEARGEVLIAGQTGIIFTPVPGMNNPAELSRLEAHMRELSGTPGTDYRIGITPREAYSPDHARISWVRTGYLAAFALFGWRYILQPALQPVRDQLADPSAVTLPPLSMYIPDGDPGRREIWVVKKPTEDQSVLVLCGRHGVFLPLPGDRRSLAELADSIGGHTQGPVRHDVTGDMYRWPSGPAHLLDPDPQPAGGNAGQQASQPV